MLIVAALAAGVLFGAGLAVSGMINPSKIIGFLDVAAIPSGGWDPTLGVVFAAALAPMFVAYAIQGHLSKPALGGLFQIPKRTEIDTRLLAGSAIFGIGWGLAGLCPGPAIAALGAAKAQLPMLFGFIAAMVAGVVLGERAASAASAKPAPGTATASR